MFLDLICGNAWSWVPGLASSGKGAWRVVRQADRRWPIAVSHAAHQNTSSEESEALESSKQAIQIKDRQKRALTFSSIIHRVKRQILALLRKTHKR